MLKLVLVSLTSHGLWHPPHLGRIQAKHLGQPPVHPPCVSIVVMQLRRIHVLPDQRLVANMTHSTHANTVECMQSWRLNCREVRKAPSSAAAQLCVDAVVASCCTRNK